MVKSGHSQREIPRTSAYCCRTCQTLDLYTRAGNREFMELWNDDRHNSFLSRLAFSNSYLQYFTYLSSLLAPIRCGKAIDGLLKVTDFLISLLGIALVLQIYLRVVLAFKSSEASVLCCLQQHFLPVLRIFPE